MDRLTRHQVLPDSVIRERIKQRMFRFMYEHDDLDFLDVMAQLIQYLWNAGKHASRESNSLDQVVDNFLKKFDHKERNIERYKSNVT